MSSSAAPPPSYEEATTDAPPPKFMHRARNGISPAARRSMEDEGRPLPDGWVRAFDPPQAGHSDGGHQFFVDTRADPPRAIWHHPYDDDEYMQSLPAEERARIRGLSRHPTEEDVVAESTDESDGEAGATRGGGQGSSGKGKSGGHRGLGRVIKDKLTGKTHAQRQEERTRRAERERALYQQHQAFRRALETALSTGRPQLLGKDDRGTDMYLEPPGSHFPGVVRTVRMNDLVHEVHYRPGANVPEGRHLRLDGLYGGLSGPGGGMGGVGGMAGPGMAFGRPGMAYGRPGGVYRRPNGMGYGGGMGMFPMMAPLAGGVMLGSLMF